MVDRLTIRSGIWEADSPIGELVKFGAKVLAFLLFILALCIQIKTLVFGRGSSAHHDKTALELNHVFSTLNVNADDLVIFQTMMWPTFESLLEINIQAEQTYACDAVFIVHEDWTIYDTAYIKFTPKNLQKRVLESLPFKRSKILSTNQPLSEFCKVWSGYQPAVVKEIEYPVEKLPARKQSAEGTRRILIPGLHRGDKNFESIGHLVKAIASLNLDIQFCVHESVLARGLPPSQYAELFSVYSDIAGAGMWMEFLNGFDVILLPYGNIYRHRISGIIHEARLLNIPVICNNKIADAGLLADRRFLYGENGEGVKEAMQAALEANHATAFFVEQYPNDINSHVSEAAGWVGRVEKPVAVQIKPAWTRCGTSVVLDAQLDYLVERGYFVVEIYLKTEPWLATPGQIEFLWQVMRGGRENTGGMVARVLMKDIRLFPLLKYVALLIRKKIPAFFKRENIHSTWCTPDPSIVDFLKKNTAELVLVNHIFNNDFAFKFIPAKIYICETHDIQINQLLLRRPELLGNYDNELNYEVSLLEQYDAVINLNQNEHKLIEGRIGSNAAYIRPPIISRPTALRYKSLIDLVAAEAKNTTIDSMPETLDLLIIGDGHPANIESIQKFIDEVFYALPQGTSLGLIGAVVKHIELDEAKSEHIYPVGFIEHLSNVYDFASLLILPDIIGEGIPIKTDEAIANKMPFVATEHAMRGFSAKDLAAAGIVAARNPEEMLEAINKLLNSETLRVEMRANLEDLASTYDMKRYSADWNAVERRLALMD